MQILPTDLQAGEDVVVRRQRWRISRIRAYEDCRLLAVSGLGPANLGVERHFLAPFDVVERTARRRTLRVVGARTWRRACRAAFAGAAPAAALRAAADAEIDLLPHQLEPALAVVAGRGTRILLADAVGLGKTIQAGLIVAELRAREAADHVLILTPAGLRDQWCEELSRRFAIEAAIVDAASVRHRGTMLPLGVNPWTTVETAIVSIDYVKRPEALAAVAERCWDVIVVDEAHCLGDETDRYRAVAALAGRAACVVLLTATPHNGDRRTFLSLCRVGCRGEPLLVFRRTRAAIRGDAVRRVHRLYVAPTAAESRLHGRLAQFARAVRAERGDRGRDVWLALAVLHKRALSSARSLELSIGRRLAALAGEPDPQAAQLPLPLDPSGELDEADAAPAWPAPLGLRDASRERRLLEALARTAAAAARHETKIAAVRRLLARVKEPAIVFTEFRDTLLQVAATLPRAAAVVHGGLSRAERLAALDDFAAGRRPWLLATDAAGQGLNLHRRCRTVINLELPWSPVRLEQRIGRVDRIGQTRVVHAFHLIGRGTAEAAVLERLQSRISTARADIGASDPLGIDDEAVVAREAIGRLPAAPEAERGLCGVEQTPRVSLDLSREARTEAGRLSLIRRHVAAEDRRALSRLEATAPWLAWIRSRRSRAILGDRALLILRCALEDATGRQVAQTLVPMAIELADGERVTREILDGVWRASVDRAALQVSRATGAWRRDSERIASAFAAVRLARARETSDALAGRSDLIQPGLFDRRAEARRSAADAQADAFLAAIAAREVDARRRAGLRLGQPEPWLLLVR